MTHLPVLGPFLPNSSLYVQRISVRWQRRHLISDGDSEGDPCRLGHYEMHQRLCLRSKGGWDNVGGTLSFRRRHASQAFGIGALAVVVAVAGLLLCSIFTQY